MVDTFEAPEKIHILVSGYDAVELYIVHEYGTGNLVALTNTERVLFAAELEHRYNTYATLVEALTKITTDPRVNDEPGDKNAGRAAWEMVQIARNALALAARKEGGQ